MVCAHAIRWDAQVSERKLICALFVWIVDALRLSLSVSELGFVTFMDFYLFSIGFNGTAQRIGQPMSSSMVERVCSDGDDTLVTAAFYFSVENQNWFDAVHL